MDREIGRARFGELPDEGVRVRHHQVDVERQGSDLAEGFDDGRSDGQVRDEMAVHDIHVHQVRAGLLDGGDLVSQMREVCGQNGRRDSHLGHMSAPGKSTVNYRASGEWSQGPGPSLLPISTAWPARY